MRLAAGSLKCSSMMLVTVIATHASAQEITGSVHDLRSGEPLSGVVVSLLSDAKAAISARTDSTGIYRIVAPVVGSYRLRVSRVGFAPIETRALKLTRDSSLTRYILLKPQSTTTLPTVAISGKPVVRTTSANAHKFDEFLQRRARGVDFFLTHDEIAAKNTFKLQQLLQSIPGIKVRQIGSSWHLQSQHCSGKKIPGAGEDESRLPIVFIDGHFTRGTEELESINTSQIEGLEVYQGGSQLPAEALGKAWFAIFVWLRTSGP